MIIPVRCYSCGKILANKWNYYQTEVRKKKIALNLDPEKPSLLEIEAIEVKKTPEGEVLDELGMVRYCCRKIFLGHINIIDEI
jgi:DNA-directed RNA polymerase subunit N (RpoN/RPB10)